MNKLLSILSFIVLFGGSNAFIRNGFRSTSGLVLSQRTTMKPAINKQAICTSSKHMTMMADTEATPIQIFGNNIEVTPGLDNHIRDKLNQHLLGKFSQTINKVEVHLTVVKNPRASEGHTAEFTAYLKNQVVVRVVEKSADMYASIDVAVHRVARKLRKFKDQITSKPRGEGLAAAFSDEDFEEDDDVPDMVGIPGVDIPDLPTPSLEITKRKSFPMPKISVDDAALCLDYIDHDFYVFKNGATDQINVIYRRDTGGLGLIEPDA